MKPWLLVTTLLLSSFLTFGGKTNTLAKPDSNENVRELILMGKQLYEAGKLNEAAISLKRALKIEPKSKAAYYYLDLVNEAKYYNEADAREHERRDSLYPQDILPMDPPKSAATGKWLSLSTQRKSATDNLQHKQYRLDKALVLQKFSPPVEKKNHDIVFHENFNEWMKTINVDWSSVRYFYTDSISGLDIYASTNDLPAIESALKPLLLKTAQPSPAK
jgi:hypothetical protein